MTEWVVATAGHVDHGKSTLVRALTGIDPDRWAEEKERGLTIDLGFAPLTLPSGREVAFVDVPGHHRFVRNMLAGVGAVDACLFVVAATEGWKPQSEEHLRILELLGITHGMVALTKVGRLDADAREEAEVALRGRLASTFLEDAVVVPVDVPAGVGLEALAGALDHLVATTPAAADRGRPRLWIDRSFAAKGAGTVVTGTLGGGGVSVGDELVVEPRGAAVRVRALQSHHTVRRSAPPGCRLAVNLVGVDHATVRRGHALVRPGQWHRATVVDAELHVLGTVEHPVSRRGAYVAYLGSAEVPVRVRLLGPTGEIPPGGRGLARLWFGAAGGLPLVPGDRYVLRESGRAETVGGGEILDVDPIRPAARAAPSRSVDRVLGERGWVDADQLERLTGERRSPDVGPWVVDPEARAAATAAVRAACQVAAGTGVALAELGAHERALLTAGIDGLVVRDGRAFERAAMPLGLSPAATRVLALLLEGGGAPPDLPLADRGALRELERAGLAIEAGPVWFASEAVDRAARVLAAVLRTLPAGVAAGEARQAWGVTRKHAVPLLEHFDRTGVTRRVGDRRVAGPRLPSPEP